MTERYLTIEQRGETALVRVDRAPANALDIELLEESHRVREELFAAGPAAVVITGRDAFFSAGVDLKFVPTLDSRGQRAMVSGVNRMLLGWYSFPRPVVCAVNGHAIAGGLILALAGDHRVCSTEGKFGLTELRAGIPYPAVAMTVVRAELSPRVARRLVLHAELIDSKTALEYGLVDELVPPAHVVPRALEVAEELGRLPREAYARIKHQLRGEAIREGEKIVAEHVDPLLEGWLSAETRGAASAILASERERRS